MSLLDKTNLLITPNAFKDGKLYSVIPASGTGDCTVVRNTTATRVNSSGLIVSVAANIPRINYLTAGGIPFILDEPQRTNLLTNNNDFAPFSKEGVVIVNNATAPDGTFTADQFTPAVSGNSTTSGGGGSSNRLLIDVTTINGIYTNSVYVKSVSGNNFNLSIFVENRFTDLIKGINTVVVNNEWQRITVTGTTDSASAGVRLLLQSAQAVFLWGGQIEAASNSSSLILTLGSAVTRNADVITVAPPVGTVKITTTFSDNTTQVITSIPALFTVPEGLIKQVLMQSSL